MKQDFIQDHYTSFIPVQLHMCDDKRMKKNLSRSHALTHTTHCLQEKAPAIDNGSPNGK